MAFAAARKPRPNSTSGAKFISRAVKLPVMKPVAAIFETTVNTARPAHPAAYMILAFDAAVSS